VVGEEIAKFVVYGAALVGTLAAVAGTVRFIASQMPAQLQKTARDVLAACRAFDQRLEAMELRQTNWKAELDGLLDQIDDHLQRSESKRARAAAAESRLRQQHGGQEAEPASRDELVTQLRRKVYGSGAA